MLNENSRIPGSMVSHTEDYHLIETPGDLERVARGLSGQAWVCLDTEFVRVKTYYPKLCLLQIGTTDGTWCIDAVTCPTLEPITPVLFDPKTVKVFHSAQQDLEVLQQYFGRVPAPLFDTQVAAAALGIGEQISYRELVAKRCGVDLDKSHTRTDWSRRPLSTAQLKYAAEDVIYLCRVYAALVEELRHKQRLPWLEEDFSRIVAAQASGNSVEEAWLKVRGHTSLSRRELAALISLAAWRETVARERDRPRRWILPDETLLDLSRVETISGENLAGVPGMHERIIKRHGKRIEALLMAARRLPGGKLPEPGDDKRPTAEETSKSDGLMKLIRNIADEQEVSPGYLATRVDIVRLLRGKPGSRLAEGWRAGLTRERVTAYLAAAVGDAGDAGAGVR